VQARLAARGTAPSGWQWPRLIRPLTVSGREQGLTWLGEHGLTSVSRSAYSSEHHGTRATLPWNLSLHLPVVTPDDPRQRLAINRREAGLALSRRLNGWLITGAVAEGAATSLASPDWQESPPDCGALGLRADKRGRTACGSSSLCPGADPLDTRRIRKQARHGRDARYRA
jgi:hypothetical protein